ncbi:hypothetical protein GTV32_13055 [Gordonia sp. SID5947]|uniref:DUF6802 family protein n=1 Tax=Gordonia sp. SID5947 TaxID=2690315 RepID=UPI00136C9E70|nr:DUF6802 family protein [Gordonia sp. SID5947]MYR07175.1 hypothetical protein [Gordonia sp. SID5947]
MDMSFLGGDPLGADGFGADGFGADGFGADGFGADEFGDADRVTAGQEASSPEDHLWMHADGRVWDLGPADVDTDDDGVRDSLTRTGAGGMTVYTDADHDGQVDKITEIDAQGMFSSSTLDLDSGAWVPTDTGRLG